MSLITDHLKIQSSKAFGASALTRHKVECLAANTVTVLLMPIVNYYQFTDDSPVHVVLILAPLSLLYATLSISYIRNLYYYHRAANVMVSNV